MKKDSLIYVSSHKEAVGAAVLSCLKAKGYKNFLLASEEELDLRDARRVEEFFKRHKPENVILSAGKSGSLGANIKYPADFAEENLKIELNVIGAARRCGAKRLMFFGASCIYPVHAAQPVKENAYLTGEVEVTSQAYAVAKIAGVEFCRAISRQDGTAFFTVVPATIYGPGSAFDLENSHVITALIKKFCDAKADGEKEVVVLGTGNPAREFIYVDDLADACVFLMERGGFPGEIFNVGSGEEVSIRNLALKIKDIVGFEGGLRFDASRPDGAKRKVLDSTKLRSLGWKPSVFLDDGIKRTVKHYADIYRK